MQLLAAAVLLFLAACSPGGPPHVVVDPAMLTLVPQDTVMLAGVRLDHLRETSFYEQYVETGQVPGIDRLLKHTGAEPDDLWELLLAYNGSDAVVMARGKFTEGGLEPRIEWEGAERTSHKGYLIVSDGVRAITFMNATTALAGTPGRVREIIDMRGNSPGPPGELVEMIESIGRTNQIWAVSSRGLSEAAPSEGPLFGNMSTALRKISRFTAMANLQQGMILEIHGECETAEDAESLQSALQALSGLARFGARDNPALISLLDQISIANIENKVDIYADVPPELLEELIGELPSSLPR